MKHNDIEKNDLTTKNIFTLFITMSIPLMLQGFVQASYNLIDNYFVGLLGGTEVAAITFTHPISMLINAIGVGISVATTSLIATSFGKENKEDAEKHLNQAIICTVLVSIIIICLSIFFLKSICIALGVKDTLLGKTLAYSRIILFGSIISLPSMALMSIRTAEGKMTKVSISSIISLILNIVFNYIFIFKFDMGLKGAAYGTVLSKGFLLIYLLLDIYMFDDNLKLKIKNISLDSKVLKLLMKKSLPVIIENIMNPLGFIVLNAIILQYYGEKVLAALGIGNRINALFFIIPNGLGIVTTTLIAQNYGARKRKRIISVLNWGLILASFISIIGMFAILNFKREFAVIFTNDIVIEKHTVEFLNIVAKSLIGFSVIKISVNVLYGIKQMKLAMFIGLFRMWILRIPLVFIIKEFIISNEFSIWYSMFYSNLIMGFISLVIAIYTLKSILNYKIYKEMT